MTTVIITGRAKALADAIQEAPLSLLPEDALERAYALLVEPLRARWGDHAPPSLENAQALLPDYRVNADDWTGAPVDWAEDREALQALARDLSRLTLFGLSDEEAKALHRMIQRARDLTSPACTYCEEPSWRCGCDEE